MGCFLWWHFSFSFEEEGGGGECVVLTGRRREEDEERRPFGDGSKMENGEK